MGESFGRYELLELVGKGGMATVHRALQQGPGGYTKPCVVKRIAPHYQNDPKAQRLFLDEARVSALLNHPNLVQTFDFGEHEGVAFLAQEFVDGPNLSQVLHGLVTRGYGLPPNACLHIAQKVLDALSYAHTLKGLKGQPLELVHRDVSPHNILLARTGVVKLTDFGIARHDARDEHTQDQRIKGKPAYMAPEQAMGGAVGPPADIFSLALVLTELLTGARVRPRSEPLEVLDVRLRVNTMCSQRASVPPQLVKLILSWTALEPGQRPQTALQARAQSDLVSLAGPTIEAVAGAVANALRTSDPIDDLVLPPLDFTPSEMSQPTEPTIPTAPPVEASQSLDLGWESLPDMDPVESAPAHPLQPADEESAGEVFMSRSSGMDSIGMFGAKFSEGAAKERGAPEEAVERKPDQAGSSPLKLPTFGSKSTAPAIENEPGSLLRVPGLEDALAEADPSEEEKKPFQVPGAVWLALAGLLVAGLALGVVALYSGGDEEPTEADVGTLTVVSTPPGGRIIINGRDTGKKTPSDFQQPLNTPIRIDVRLAKHLTTPAKLSIDVPSSTKKAVASFRLLRGRQLELHSDPPEAFVNFNGHRIPRITPAKLPILPFGRTATVVLNLEDHMPHKLVLLSSATTPTVTQVKLQPAKRLEISSTPPGAVAKLNGQEIGKTPLFDVLVPAQGKFLLELRDRSHKTYRRRYRADRVSGEIAIELKPLPFLSLPWNKKERKAARDVDRKYVLTARKLKYAQSKLKKAEKTLERVENSPQATLGQMSSAQNNVARYSNEIETLTTELEELGSTKDSMRATLNLRRESQ